MPASSRVIITGIWRPPKPTTESMAKFESWASSSRPPTFTLKSDEIRAGLALPEREAEAFKQKIREAVRDSNAVVAIEVIDEISELLSEVKCEFQSLTYAGRSAMTLRGIPLGHDGSDRPRNKACKREVHAKTLCLAMYPGKLR